MLGSSILGLWTSTFCQISGSIRLEIQCTVNVMHLKHPPSPIPVHRKIVFREISAWVLSHFSRVWLFATTFTIAHQALCPRDPPAKNTSVAMPSPGDLPNPGIEPASPVAPALAGGFFTPEPQGKPPMKSIPGAKKAGGSFLMRQSNPLACSSHPGHL